jgi:hypothetical protein
MNLLLAQCVMCFRTAAAQQSERARVMNTAVLILLIPSLALFAAILLWARRRAEPLGSPDADRRH